MVKVGIRQLDASRWMWGQQRLLSFVQAQPIFGIFPGANDVFGVT
jgi:hypothetical protein